MSARGCLATDPADDGGVFDLPYRCTRDAGHAGAHNAGGHRWSTACGCAEPDLMGDGRCRACTPAPAAEGQPARVAFSSQAGLAALRYRIVPGVLPGDDDA